MKWFTYVCASIGIKICLKLCNKHFFLKFSMPHVLTSYRNIFFFLSQVLSLFLTCMMSFWKKKDRKPTIPLCLISGNMFFFILITYNCVLSQNIQSIIISDYILFLFMIFLISVFLNLMHTQ